MNSNMKNENEQAIEEVIEILSDMYRKYYYTCIMKYLTVPQIPDVAIPFFCFMFYIWQLNDEDEVSNISESFNFR